MDTESQTTDNAASLCEKYEWCDGSLHGSDPMKDWIHSRREFFLDGAVELALDVYEPDLRTHVELDMDRMSCDWGDEQSIAERSAELRRLADALDRVGAEARALERDFAEVTC